MNVKTGILLLAGLALGVSACHKDRMNGIFEQDETCSVSLALRPDYTVDEVVLTRSVEAPADGEFNIRIENTRAEVLKEWKYAELPRIIKVVPGSYKLVASYGNDTLLPAFDAPYYYGETKVTLKDGDNLDTIVKTSVATVKVALTFDESFSFDYDDYFVEVKTVGDSLHFAKDEKREGYFLPGNLRMRFGLKPIGQEAYYEFYPPVIKSVKASEFYRMTLKAQSEHGALTKISIVTDSTTVDIPVDVELPTFFLPKAAPKVTLQADVQEGENSVATTEGIAQKAMVKVIASAGLTELKIKTVSDTLLARGWPAELDLMKATDAQKELLKANGLTWTENIDLQDTIKSTVWLRFDNVVKLLSTAPGQTTISAFEILAKDRFKQESDGRFDIKVAPPVFAFVNEPGEGNVWAKRALYDVKYVSERETPVVECKGADGKWKTLKTTLTEKNTDEYECLAKGLTPATAYAFRVRLGGHTLDAGNHMTEEAAQVPNAGMEDWDITASEANWERWAINGWATYNNMTTMTSGTRHSTAYVSRSGTAQSKDAHTGTYAAELRTIGWGAGNSAVGSIKEGNPKYITKGMLYLGTSPTEYSKLDEQVEKGVSFASRPSSISFWYKYSKHNGADYGGMTIWLKDASGNVIASASKSNLDAASYTQVTLPLVYTNISAKVEQIYVEFSSSDHPNWDTRSKDWFTVPPFGNLDNGKFQGSSLFIDDIKLIYE